MLPSVRIMQLPSQILLSLLLQKRKTAAKEDENNLVANGPLLVKLAKTLRLY
jgi:hypothetical protein